MTADIFGATILLAALYATFTSETRKATLALWVAGLAAGGLYLTLGAEVLAVMQWIVSTLVAISFVFFSGMFGEYSSREVRPSWLRSALGSLAFVVLGLGFAAIIGSVLPTLHIEGGAVAEKTNDLVALGTSIADDHFIALEVLGLTLFLVLIGGGVLARPEKEKSES